MIKKLEWDSNHFGINIAELDMNKFDGDQVKIDSFIENEKISLIQACCDISDLGSISILENNGFNFVDLKMTYVLDLKDKVVDEKKFELAGVDDIATMKKMATAAFADMSRFYHKFFDRQRADELYEIWIEKAVYGELDDVCLKIESEGNLAGFITGKELGKDVRIGIIGVEEAFRRSGVGTNLLDVFFYFYRLKNKERIFVSTQGKNIPANNFYIKNGFRIESIEGWFYKKCSA